MTNRKFSHVMLFQKSINGFKTGKLLHGLCIFIFLKKENYTLHKKK